MKWKYLKKLYGCISQVSNYGLKLFLTLANSCQPLPTLNSAITQPYFLINNLIIWIVNSWIAPSNPHGIIIAMLSNINWEQRVWKWWAMQALTLRSHCIVSFLNLQKYKVTVLWTFLLCLAFCLLLATKPGFLSLMCEIGNAFLICDNRAKNGNEKCKKCVTGIEAA